MVFLLVILMFHVLDSETFEFEDMIWSFGKWSLSLKSQAFFANLNLLVFGLKNLFTSVWEPGSLMLVNSDVINVKIASNLLKALKASRMRDAWWATRRHQGLWRGWSHLTH